MPPGPDTRLTFAWSGAFRYDSSRGNLLIDIRKTGGVFFGDDGTYLDFDGSGAARMSAVNNFSGAAGLNNIHVGLVTRFSGTLAVAATPEPGTLMLLGTGGLTALGARRKRTRRG